MRKFLLYFLLVVLIVVSGFIYWRFFYVFGEGVKAGELNYMVKKGYLFKTYEGKLIQTGFRAKTPGSIASYEFEFSVVDDSLANILMLNSGKVFELHYKEYMGSLPWRGHSKYIVDGIVDMKEK